MSGSVYRLRPAARSDLEAIWQYSFRQWSVDQADAYIALILEAFEALASGARSGRPVDVRSGYFRFPCGSHMIYYRTGTPIDIVRILHQRMDVDSHL